MCRPIYRDGALLPTRRQHAEVNQLAISQVRPFFCFVLILTTGFGFALSMLLPNDEFVYGSKYTQPFFLPLWYLVGAQPDSAEIAGYERRAAN